MGAHKRRGLGRTMDPAASYVDGKLPGWELARKDHQGWRRRYLLHRHGYQESVNSDGRSQCVIPQDSVD